jgi:hypothetical protein
MALLLEQAIGLLERLVALERFRQVGDQRGLPTAV